MTVKMTTLGLLIYLTMLVYSAAFAASIWKAHKTGGFLFAIGFAVSLGAVTYRWIQVRHLPMQDLFEIFLCMAMVMYPVSIVSAHLLKVPDQAVDAALGFALLFPAGFIFEERAEQLPPSLQSPLFGPHVATYLLAYAILLKAGAQAVRELAISQDSRQNGTDTEEATYRLVRFGFPLLTLGLVLGAWWGKRAWGDYWHWDPKELWALATWLIYAGYLHFRGMFGQRFASANSLIAIGGGDVIIITLFWVNLAPRLFPGLHSYAR